MTPNLSVTFFLSLALSATYSHAALPPSPQQMPARVISVYDGDTIVVVDTQRNKYRVQLAGIDAPELNQAFGDTAKKYLARRIQNRSVILSWYKTEKDGTLIAKVTLNNGDINQLQLFAGMAWPLPLDKELYPNESKTYPEAQSTAKAKRLGLWRDNNPIPPWEWRKTHGNSAPK